MSWFSLKEIFEGSNNYLNQWPTEGNVPASGVTKPFPDFQVEIFIDRLSPLYVLHVMPTPAFPFFHDGHPLVLDGRDLGLSTSEKGCHCPAGHSLVQFLQGIHSLIETQDLPLVVPWAGHPDQWSGLVCSGLEIWLVWKSGWSGNLAGLLVINSLFNLLLAYE